MDSAKLVVVNMPVGVLPALNRFTHGILHSFGTSPSHILMKSERLFVNERRTKKGKMGDRSSLRTTLKL